MSNTYLPAEWAAQSAVMLTWPHPHGDWRSELPQVDCVFAEIGYHVCRHQGLIITCWDQFHAEHITRQLRDRGAAMNRVGIYTAHSNDAWARDHGPIAVVRDGQPTLLDFQFNGWGDKYPAALDNAITDTLHRQRAFGHTPLRRVDLVLEGGSIDCDGQGTLLTTRRCLLSPHRNPQLDQRHLEEALAQTLGIQRVLWLNYGHLEGDDTDSHIDTLVRFCDPDTLCYTACDDSRDSHYRALNAMENELAAFRTAKNTAYRRIPLPIPSGKYNDNGLRLPATYANFLIINDAVLVPTYDDPADHLALERLSHCFPDREIIGINCLPLIEQYGSLHCVTMQLPQGIDIEISHAG